MSDFSKLKPFIADKAGAKNSVLILEGFSSKEEIEEFMDKLLSAGIVKPNQELKQ